MAVTYYQTNKQKTSTITHHQQINNDYFCWKSFDVIIIVTYCSCGYSKWKYEWLNKAPSPNHSSEKRKMAAVDLIHARSKGFVGISSIKMHSRSIKSAAAGNKRSERLTRSDVCGIKGPANYLTMVPSARAQSQRRITQTDLAHRLQTLSSLHCPLSPTIFGEHFKRRAIPRHLLLLKWFLDKPPHG